MTFAELVRALDAAKSSVHGFIRGLLAKGWLYEEQVATISVPRCTVSRSRVAISGPGLVTHADLAALHEETGVAVFLGVQAGDHLIYIAEAGSDSITGFEARSNIRRPLLATAGGKALLVARSDGEREAYLRRRSTEEADLVEQFLEEYAEIKRTRIARTFAGGTRFGIATTVHNQSGEAVAAIMLVGLTAEVQPRVQELAKQLLRHVDWWPQRSMTPREAI